MSAFRYAHAGGATWRECADACVTQIGRVNAGLGFLYFTDTLVAHAESNVEALRAGTGVQDWVGTVGIGILATGTEYLELILFLYIGQDPLQRVNIVGDPWLDTITRKVVHKVKVILNVIDVDIRK